jgi:hypothetical protein
MFQVFVSYSRKNLGATQLLIQDLETLGHAVWFDQELAGGQVWWDQVLARIRAGGRRDPSEFTRHTNSTS